MITASPSSSFPSSIVVGNGATLPVVGTGYSTLPGPFHLNNVLIAPDIIKNLLSVRKFTTDNSVSVEFDPLGVSVKDLRTRNTLLRCNSSGPLYTLQLPSSPSGPCALVATPSPTTWHRRLGHPGKAVLQNLAQSSSIICSKSEDDSLCHACQLGRHVRLPFTSSLSRASKNFDLIHCDLWTSPIISVSGFKYYLVIIDDCSHFLWTFPLRLNLTPSLSSPTSLPLCTLSLAVSSSPCNVITVVNLTTLPLVLSSLPKVFLSACHAPTPRSKMAKPNACFAPPTMSLARCSSKPPCPRLTGLMLLLLPPTS